jgi:hypothetical protein
MNNSVKTLLLAAAGTGLMSGTATVQPVTVPTLNGRSLSVASLGQMPATFAADGAPHACKAQNACKGQGGCNNAPNKNGCKGKNDCKGQGGCKTTM